MFKFVILAALCAVAAAGPSLIGSNPLLYSSRAFIPEGALADVGSFLKSVPTAVSHQSQTIVHGQDQIVQPIIAPVVKTYAAPLVRTYSYSASPVVAHSVPLTYAAPLAYAATATAPLHVAASSPLTYTATTGW